MSKPAWTKQQQQVIDLRERNILVSAAAGSGKTAVLVERIIAETTQGDSPMDIDRLLVVTFTKAAAAEMRMRIGIALEKKLQENPMDEHLQRQVTLLHNAQISTIDSFCSYIVRNYFHVIELDPVFRVADKTDLDIMKVDVLQEVLEEKYKRAREEGDEEFLHFTDVFSPGRTDHAIEELVLKLHDISESYPWPKEWLLKCIEMYACQSEEEWENCPWMQELLSYIRKCIHEFAKTAKEAWELCENHPDFSCYEPVIHSEYEALKRMEKLNTYREYSEQLAGYQFVKLPPVRGKDIDQEMKARIQSLRKVYKDSGITKLKEKFFFQPVEEMFRDMEAMAEPVRQLLKLTMEFSEAFAQRKREDGVVDFSDIEHFALEILVKREDGVIKPSQTALELQDYYQEILIDEYQDSNYVQEILLNSLCRAPKEAPYLFMVGDVKQSIYSFRLARPDLFIEKYISYQLKVEDNKYQRIDLQKNFRSRKCVLDAANFLFEQLMQKSFGGIAYDEEASLIPGADFGVCKERTASQAEVLLIEQTSENEQLGKKATEAAVIGNKIKDMVQGEHPLYVRDGEEYRPVKYRDIVILLRSMSDWSEEFIEVLTDMGIPCYAETKTGYFTSLEVETILNLLYIIDNPRQDIPLTAVLRSVIVGVTDEELAWLASLPRGIDYWDAILLFVDFMSWKKGIKDCSEEHARRGIVFSAFEEKIAIPGQVQESLYAKLSDFLDMLERYRDFAKRGSVYELLRKIYQETDYYAIMSAMPAGEKRKANLDILLQQSVEFAENGHQGIFGFTRYIMSLKKSDVDFGEASVNNENMDAVRIMTIHKSKGLEFPVVFVAGMGKQFNLQDAKSAVMLDSDYGIGCNFVDLEASIKLPTLAKKAMANHITQNCKEEEVRILYVALTRAKEKLIISGTASNMKKKIEKWKFDSEDINFFTLSKAGTYLDWIMPVVARRTAISNIMEDVITDGIDEGIEIDSYDQDDLYRLQIICPEELVAGRKEDWANELKQYQKLRNWDIDCIYDEQMHQSLVEQVTYQYPYEKESSLPVKISVSELKKRELEMNTLLEEEKTEISGYKIPEEENEEIVIPKPAFMEEVKEVSGAARGTLYHMVMEHMPYEKVDENFDVGQFLRSMTEAGYITPEEEKLLYRKKFITFLKSPLGKRMKKAADQNLLRREQPFMLGIPAKELYSDIRSDENIVVQGIIDAYFFEGDDIVLVDYKTDHVEKGNEQELVKKYEKQLAYYAQALERLTGKAVKEKLIYSFALEKEIRI